MSDLVKRMKEILRESDRGIIGRNRNCDQTVTGLFGEAADEIEKLQVRVEELEETIAFLDPPYGILELEDQLDAANERVEELEKAYDKLLHQSWHDWKLNTHEFSNKQIDLAWAEAEDEFAQHGTRRALIALSKLNIVRCENCIGTGHIAEEDENGELLYATGGMPIILNCPDCDEHGWVVKELEDGSNPG